jgi:nucleotide-binding universal stress UspA family protein
MQAIKDILVLAEGGPEDAGTIDYAVRLASQHGAHLTGAFALPALRADGPVTFVRGPAITELLREFGSESALLEKTAHTLFERAARGAELAAEWRTIPPYLEKEFIVHARYADLAIVSRRARDRGRGSPDVETVSPVSLAEAVVFASGCPVILLPRSVPATLGKRVLVGWNASREATRAVADALPFLTRAEAVELLIVDPDRRPEAHGPAPGADIARHLARHAVTVNVRVVESGSNDVGSLLLDRAATIDSDLLVMGAYGRSRLTEFIFGGATRTAMHEAELPVFMSR